MRSMLLRWAINALAVVIAARLLPEGIRYTGWQSVAAFAIILGLLNAFVRPVIRVLTLPLTCLTVGLFTLVINGAMFWLAAKLTDVQVTGFLPAFLGALAVSVISTIATFLTKSDRSTK